MGKTPRKHFGLAAGGIALFVSTLAVANPFLSAGRKLTRSALVWAARHGRPGDAYRFDVVAVLLLPDRVRVRHRDR